MWTYQGTDLVAVTERTEKKTPAVIGAFIRALAEHGNVSRACREANVPRLTVYYWRDNDEDFKRLWDAAREVAKGSMEDEALRRAFEGVDKPVVYKGELSYQMEPLLEEDGTPAIDSDGQVVMVRSTDEHGRPIPLTVKEYSDSLAQFMLKAMDPETYRDRTDVRVEESGLAEKLQAARRRLAERNNGPSGGG